MHKYTWRKYYSPQSMSLIFIGRQGTVFDNGWKSRSTEYSKGYSFKKKLVNYIYKMSIETPCQDKGYSVVSFFGQSFLQNSSCKKHNLFPSTLGPENMHIWNFHSNSKTSVFIISWVKLANLVVQNRKSQARCKH